MKPACAELSGGFGNTSAFEIRLCFRTGPSKGRSGVCCEVWLLCAWMWGRHLLGLSRRGEPAKCILSMVPPNKTIICTNSSCTSFWLSSDSSKKCSSLLTHEKVDNLLPSQRPEPAWGVMRGRQEPREEMRWARTVGMGGNPSPQGSARP